MIHAHVTTVALIAAAIGGYLLGSIPTGVIATRLAGLDDIRSVGSGNIGATNVLRTGRRDLALITLIGDAAKGAAAVLIFGVLIAPLAGVVAGGAALVGHDFPIWLRFRGGKGVATFFGVLIAAAWPAGLAAGAVWIVMAAIFRFSSLAALVAAALSPVLVGLLLGWGGAPFWLAVFMAVLIFVRHRENLERLIEGKEARIGKAT